MTILDHPETVTPITASVRALIAAHGMKVADVANHLGMPPSRLYRRLNQHTWTAEEVALLAIYFRRSPQDLFDGNVGTISTPPGRLRVVEPRAGIEPATVRLQGEHFRRLAVQALTLSGRLAA